MNLTSAMRAFRSLTIVIGSVLAACVERPIDDVVWECLGPHQCGEGQRCRAGVCASEDGPLAGGKACVAALDVAGKDARFGMSPADDGLWLEVVVDGRRARFPLPDSVVGLDGEGIHACCESPCCE